MRPEMTIIRLTTSRQSGQIRSDVAAGCDGGLTDPCAIDTVNVGLTAVDRFRTTDRQRLAYYPIKNKKKDECV